ncbi:hypothetical protein B0H14DRAFT_2648921 [Mycena olivaceomarginata]|nr:hypothetical protein B0H14DRAFT_2648921 [Mycena olivaceomarginata]
MEFKSKANKGQGQLHNVIVLLPSDAVLLQTEPWIAGTFEDGMSGQCLTISNRLRHTSLQVLMGANQLKHFRSLLISSLPAPMQNTMMAQSMTTRIPPPPPAQSGGSRTGHECQHDAEEQFPSEKKQAVIRWR